MNPVVLAVIGLGIGMIALGGGGGGTKQPLPSRPSGPRSGKSPKVSTGGDLPSGGGSAPPPSPSPRPSSQVRQLQAALNLYAAAVGRPASQAASTGTLVRWPLAEDGVRGAQTEAAAIEVLVQSDALSIVMGGGTIPGVEGRLQADGETVLLTDITNPGALATFIEQAVERGGAAPGVGSTGGAPTSDELRSHFSQGLAAEREGDVATAAEIYREVIALAPEGSDLWRQASSRLAGLRMRHGSGV